MGYFIWLILSRKSIFGHTIKFLEPGRSSTDQSAFIASEFELRQKIENRCRRLIKIRDIPPPIWIWPTTGFYLLILWLCLSLEVKLICEVLMNLNQIILPLQVFNTLSVKTTSVFVLSMVTSPALHFYRLVVPFEYTKNTIFKNYLF